MKDYTSYFNAAILIAIMVLLPLYLSSYYTGLLTLLLVYAIFGMSLNLLLGYTGLPSLGHSAFWGTSAYMVAILNVKIFEGSNFGVELIAGVLAAIIIAAIFGPFLLRSKGIYFLMSTLASSMMLWGIAFKWRWLTGGDDGLPYVLRPDLSIIGWDLRTVIHYYYFVLFFFIISAMLMWLIVHSPFGRALLGIRENEMRMRSLGYNVWLYKYIIFIVTAGFAGLGGILFAYYNCYVNPNVLHLITSAEGLIMVVLGGAGVFIGPVIGAGVMIFVKNFVSAYTEHWMMILGAVYVLSVLFAPQGIYTLVKSFLRRLVHTHGSIKA